MVTLIDNLIWLAIAAASTALVWLYAASWRAVAEALAEAAEHPAQETPGGPGSAVACSFPGSGTDPS